MTDELPIDADREIVDPHHHLWDHPGNRYLLEDLRSDTGSGHRVTTTVFVECMSAYRIDGPEYLRPVGETDFVAQQAAESEQSAAAGSVIGAIVGFADLTDDAVDETLAAHVEAAGGRFRGVRHATAYDPSPEVRPSHTNPRPGLLGEADFGRGVDALGRAGLLFEAWLYHPQLPEFVALAQRHPDVRIVLDHLGGPLGIGSHAQRPRRELMAEWREAMAGVARCPNVTLKLGGIGMPIFGLGWHRGAEKPTSQQLADAWGDDIRWCIETFGADRCMFESNFPVDKRSCSYVALWNAFQRMSANSGAGAAELDLLFSGTARRTYGLTR